MILINDNGKIKWIHFGDRLYDHYTEGHLDEKRKQAYFKRNEDRDEARNNYNTAGFWAHKEAYEKIKLKILKKYLK
jgi:phosphopantetheinyl transferase (holo-ACP synthase)